MTDHRIVLNKNVLGQLKSDNNIQVFKRADVLQDFLRTFAGECQITAEPRQPVLLMVFGHGDSKTYGIAVGGIGAPRNVPRLRTHEIAAYLNGLDISLTVLLTSCFSRGWVLQPELNISAFTAVGPLIETRSWGNSLGDRCHGSIDATAVREAFIKMEDEKTTQIHPHRPRGPLDEKTPSRSFAELTSVIHSTLLYEIDSEFGHAHHTQLSAQDNKWELEWRKRSGILLARCQAQWDKLPRLQVQSTASMFRGKTVGLAALSLSETESEDPRGTYGLHKRLSERQASRIVNDMSFGYLTSFPAPENAGPDRRVARLASRFLEGKDMSSEYNGIMGVHFANCSDWF